MPRWRPWPIASTTVTPTWPGLVLDCVDHRLDTLPDDDRLDLGHRARLLPGPKKKTPGALPLRPRCLFRGAVLGTAKRRHRSARSQTDASRYRSPMPKTLIDRIWESHVVHEAEGEPDLLYVDLHLIHEVTSAQAFEGLRLAGRTVRRPDLSLATMDHNVPTDDGPVERPARARAARGAADELRRVRRPALRDGQRARGDRPRHRPGARPHAAGR